MTNSDLSFRARRTNGETTKPRSSKDGKLWRKVRLQLERLALLGVILAAWHIVDSRQVINPMYSTSPLEAFRSLVKLLGEGEFYYDLTVTLRELVIGWIIGSTIGAILGLLVGRFAHARDVVYPFMQFVNAIPKIALAPILILWFGIGEPSKVATAVIVVVFIVQVPVTSAVAMVDPNLLKLYSSLGASELQSLRQVYLPAVIAPMMGALRLGAIYSLLSVVFAEFLAARHGLGQRLITATNTFALDQAVALMVVLASLALLINGLIGLVERRMLRWQRDPSGGAVVSL